jgi:hypothetical protein
MPVFSPCKYKFTNFKTIRLMSIEKILRPNWIVIGFHDVSIFL